MIFNRKAKNREKLLNEFGNIKDDSFDFGLIAQYFQRKQHKGTIHVLSDKTCNDLDFNELFMFVDRTISKVGQQFLYDKLRIIPLQKEDTKGSEKIIEGLLKNPEFRVDIQTQLTKLKAADAYYISSLFQDEHLNPPTWFFLVRILSFTSLFSLIMLFFNPQMILVFTGVFILNIGIHYWNKKNLNQYMGSLPLLLKLNKVARELFKISELKEVNPDLTTSIDEIDKVKARMHFFNLEAKLQGDFEALFWGILEIIKIVFLIEPLLLFGILKRLDTKRKEVEDVFAFVGQIDSMVSVSSLRAGLGTYCIPEINGNNKTIIANEVYHPLIPDCVQNSIYIDKKSVLLTGSNMSGKTSFIRAIGINTLTGLTINTCFAKQFALSPMRIYSAIRISDDLMNDKSYYFEEVLTIKEMVEQSKDEKANLFLLDEIFKGTNTIERISAGKAVLSSLTKQQNIVFVSTHDIELADLLENEYELYHFSEKVDNKTVDFDYKIKEGKLKNRNAIRILQINGYPEDIIEEAIELSKVLDRTF